MHLVVNALSAHTGGGITYLRSLLRALLAANTRITVDLVCRDRRPFDSLAEEPRLRLLTVGGLSGVGGLLRRIVWEQVGLPRCARRLGADVLFCPAEIAPLRCRIPVLLGLQNPNLYERPVPFASRRQEARLRLLRWAARASARRAARVLFVSEPFRKIALTPLRVPEARTRVVSPGLDPIFVATPPTSARFMGSRPYLLAVSDFYPYKKLTSLVDLLAELRHERPNLRLLVAGRAVDAHDHRDFVERVRLRGLTDHVDLLGAVPLDEMPALYSSAECMVFPSVLESLGFPPLEAMACGVPVACARASVMPEVCGDGALYFDPDDPQDLVACVGRILSDDDVRAQLVERGRHRAARYDWNRAGVALAAICFELAPSPTEFPAAVEGAAPEVATEDRL